MIKLIIDAGNTSIKMAVFIDNKIVDQSTVNESVNHEIERIITAHGKPFSCIISTVRKEKNEFEVLNKLLPESRIITFRGGLRLPVKNQYKTPETLGNDRLANACAAWSLNPKRNSLVVDCGTCIKYDFVNSTGTYEGGSISPGLEMRYKALNKFTGLLPLLHHSEEFPALTGQSTEGAIRSGVENGMLAEINGMVKRYRELSDQTDIILTGGDHIKFAGKLKSPIFVAPNLTLNGLKVILDHNDH